MTDLDRRVRMLELAIGADARAAAQCERLADLIGRALPEMAQRTCPGIPPERVDRGEILETLRAAHGLPASGLRP